MSYYISRDSVFALEVSRYLPHLFWNFHDTDPKYPIPTRTVPSPTCFFFRFGNASRLSEDFQSCMFVSDEEICPIRTRILTIWCGEGREQCCAYPGPNR
jgi:hypothetical protein